MSNKYHARDYRLAARHFFSHSRNDKNPHSGSVLISPYARVNTREDNGAYVECLLWVSDNVVDDFYKGEK